MNMSPIRSCSRRGEGLVVRVLALLPIIAAMVIATPLSTARADTDISNQPLATRPSVSAKPNLLFILDDSGSMNLSYMPDDLGATGSSDSPNATWRGYRSAQCNGLAFDPALEYPPPLMPDGVTTYANASFTAAPFDGYVSGSSTTDLSNSVYYNYKGTQPRMGWVYTSAGPVNNTFLQECKTSTTSSTAANALFEPVTVTSTSTEAQKYANWYSYYRKRYLLMRTSMGRAISKLDASYRVGFSRINKDTVANGDDFRNVKDFDTQQKIDFYSSLYGATPSGNTPLRKALSKAGRYFANKVADQAYDPVQYSCQRNFALLSTDGYWNSSYGVDLAGNNVGQQDGAEARPMRDGSAVVDTTVVTHTASATRNSTVTTTKTRTATRETVTVSSTTGGSCNNNRYAVRTETQTRSDTETSTATTPQTGTATYTTTTIMTDGVLTSGPTDGSVTTSNWINVPPTTTTGPTAVLGAWSTPNVSTACQRNAGDGKAVTTETVPNFGNAQNATAYSALTTGPFTASQPVTTTTTPGGTPNTLADVAQYFYATDLRTSALGNCTASNGENVCVNTVPSTDSDPANWQHMNTYTIGLGVSGTIQYDRNYLTQTVGAFADIKSGAANWPQPEGYNSTGSGGDATNVDDLWHAAVNGRGRYYSALNASELSAAISGVVESLTPVTGASAAAATSSVDLVSGDDNQIYRASYTTREWTGDLQAYAFNGTTGAIASTYTWSAQQKLDAAVPSARTIYFSGTGGLQAFTYDNLSASQKAYFSGFCSKPGMCTDVTAAAEVTLANSGANLVNYLRGDKTYDTTSTLAKLYRARAHVLGDVINGAPVRVGKPPFTYADAGYADFVTTNASRTPVVYVAANDGMLHALSAATDGTGGQELWAFVPTAVMPKLYKLADKNYSVNHQYFVDGPPIMADIKVGSSWKTIMVGGLGGGGGSYYALDITVPNRPVLLWEFSNANLGLTYGNPVIGKRADGTWVVAFASGYNNSGGDGQGHLYVLNANSGEVLLDMATGVGTSASPSGLTKINAWVTSRTNNTIERIYGGDLEGNLWRFDIDNVVLPHQAAVRLAKFQIDASTPQPITTKPELVEISNKPVIIVGTGRYLGVTDIDSTTQQGIYAVKDPMTATGWGDVRVDTTNFVQQTMTLSGSTASITDLPVDWATKAGWWVDFKHSRERVTTNMALLSDTLMIGTAIPSGDACTSGGSSWFYSLDAANGGVVSNNPVGEQWSATSLIAGQTLVRDARGNIRNLVQNTDGTITQKEISGSTSGLGSARRTSWRELMD